MFKERHYRSWVESDDLASFIVKEKETDLLIMAKRTLEEQARESILSNRSDLERYIKANPEFYTSLEPVKIKDDAPEIVKAMGASGEACGVGPMASVAGAMAEFVGRDLLAFSDEIIIENGGDIFIKTFKPRKIGIYAGENSPFTGKLAIEVGPSEDGLGVCTSSGTVSHSLSFGKADAALIIAENASLADAAATAAGNAVKGPQDVEKALALARSIEGVLGVMILIGDKMGSWGAIKLA
jgi:hypothetical protein